MNCKHCQIPLTRLETIVGDECAECLIETEALKKLGVPLDENEPTEKNLREIVQGVVAESLSTMSQNLFERISEDIKSGVYRALRKNNLEQSSNPATPPNIPDSNRCCWVDVSGVRCTREAEYKTREGKFMCSFHNLRSDNTGIEK